jgi:uracil-DNA glycosylase
MTNPPDRRAAFLAEMGITPLWRTRDVPQPPVAPMQVEESIVAHGMARDSAHDLARDDVPAFFDEAAWSDSDIGLMADVDHVVSAPPVAAVHNMTWAELKENVASCVKCGLCQGRTRTVFGVGDEKAKWLFVGEGPGRNEDQRGEPFVGNAGKLLDNMLLAMGLKRGDNAYIANIVKCRPTDDTGKDRPPTPQETAACLPYLERQIALINPTVIVALGKTAALSLLALDPETPVSKLRGSVHRYAERPLVVTYHPAYLLRNMADKKKAWADLCLAMATYAGAA